MDNFSQQVMGKIIAGVALVNPKETMLETVLHLEDRYAKLQSRRSIIRQFINNAHEDIAQLKPLNREFYEWSTPSTYKGKTSFEAYKQTRIEIQHLKRCIKALVETQCDIKQQMQQTSALIRMLNNQIKGM